MKMPASFEENFQKAMAAATLGGRRAITPEHEAFLRQEAQQKSTAIFEKIDKIKSKVQAGSPVSGEELLLVADSLDIKVHPRSSGVIKKMWGITEREAMASRGVGKGSQSPFQLYTEVRSRLV